jgi:hypothetical protein
MLDLARMMGVKIVCIQPNGSVTDINKEGILMDVGTRDPAFHPTYARRALDISCMEPSWWVSEFFHEISHLILAKRNPIVYINYKYGGETYNGRMIDMPNYGLGINGGYDSSNVLDYESAMLDEDRTEMIGAVLEFIMLKMTGNPIYIPSYIFYNHDAIPKLELLNDIIAMGIFSYRDGILSLCPEAFLIEADHT